MKQPWWPSSAHRVTVVVCVGVCLACDGAPEGESRRTLATVEPAGEAARAADAAASAPEDVPAEVPEITPFGVPECDAYVKKYLACVGRMGSGEQKERLIEAFEANRTKWRALATMREGAVALGLACRAAALKSKEELTVEYGHHPASSRRSLSRRGPGAGIHLNASLAIAWIPACAGMTVPVFQRALGRPAAARRLP